MNGPEHYREAEKLLDSCLIDRVAENEVYAPVGADYEDGVDSCRNALMAAQVHASLAHVAAIADLHMTDFESLVGRDRIERRDSQPDTWAGVISSTIGGAE